MKEVPHGRPSKTRGVWILAWKEAAALRFRAVLAFLGVVTGTFALTTMGSMALHFHRMAARFETYVKGKTFIREKAGFFGAGALSEKQILDLKKNPAVRDAVPVLAARLRPREFIVFGFPQTALGLPPPAVPSLFSGVPLLWGNWPQDRDECVLGSDIAGGRVRAPSASFVYLGERLRVSGVMARTDGPEDAEMIASLRTLESLLGRQGLVSYGVVLLKPAADSAAFAHWAQIRHRYWEVLSASFLSAQVRKSEILWDALTVGIGVIAALVGGTGILTVMMMAAQERIPEIAIAKALGAGRGQIFSLFLFQSFIFSGIGSLIGFGVSLLFVKEAGVYLSRQGMVLFEPSPRLLMLNFAAAVVLALLGGACPAYYGSQLKPAEALRR